MAKVKQKQGFMRIATVVMPHGVRGELKLKPFTEDPYALLDYGMPQLFDGTEVVFEGFRQGPKGLLLAKIKGVDDRDVAERWRGVDFYLPIDALPEPEDADDAYFAELHHAAVVLADGSAVGKVVDLYDTGANAVLVVRPAEGVHPENKDFLLPYIAGVVVRFDRQNHTVVVADIAEYLAL